MKENVRRLGCGWLVLICTIFMLTTMPEAAAAYDYGNLLSTSYSYGGFWTHSLSHGETITLSPADIVRANKGDLYYVANSHLVGYANRKASVGLTVFCMDASGKILLDGTYGASDSRYWVATPDYTYNSGNKRIPAGTTQIYYVTGLTLDDWGGEGEITLSDMYLKLYDDVKPAYSTALLYSINDQAISASVAGTYPAGTKLRYAVNFTEPVNISNSGSFNVSLSGTAYAATYAGQSANLMTAYYDYYLPTSGTVSDTATVKMSSISNLTVADQGGNSETINRATLADGFGVLMDNKPPQVTSLATGASQGASYTRGEQLTFRATFHENVSVTGGPSITLSNGKTATYVAGSGSDSREVNFVYTVGSGDTNTDLLAITSVNFTGVVDYVGQAANYNPDAYDNLLASYRVMIDTIAPTVTFSDPSAVWHDQDYTVSVSATDVSGALTGTGVDELYAAWSLSGATAPEFPTVPNVGSDNLIYAPGASGEWRLWVKSVDNAANSRVTVSPYTYKYDRSDPTVVVTARTVGGYPGLADVSVVVTDSHSGVKSKRYEWLGADHLTVVLSGNLADGISYPGSDGVYSLRVTAEDIVQNETVSVTDGLSIDRTPPDVSFLPLDNADYQRSHSVDIDLSDEKTGVVSFAYQWTTSPAVPASGWQPTTDTAFTTPSGASGSYYLAVKATDGAGNVGYAVGGAYNLDNTPPTIVVSKNGNAGDVGRGEYIIGITVTDAITLTSELTTEYAFSTSESPEGLLWQPLTGTAVTLSGFDATTYLHVRATDALGNSALFKSNAFIADTTAPTGSIVNISGPYLRTAAVQLGFAAADDYSSADNLMMQLTVDGVVGEWEPFVSGKAAVSFAATEGTHSFSVQYRDESGNLSEAYSASVTFDVTPPEIGIAYSPAEPTNGDVTATATSSGTFVGVSSHIFTENGSYTFSAVDEAGNVGEATAQVNWIDKTVPTISFTSSQLDNHHHRAVSVKVNAADNANSIASLQYRFVRSGEPAGEWLTCANGESVTLAAVDGSYRLEARAVDSVGNVASSQSGLLYLDNTPPVAAFQYTPGTRTAQNVQVVISFDEGATISNNGGNNTYVFTDNGSFQFEFQDEAGNSTTATAIVDWIDRTIPEATVIITDEAFAAVTQDRWVNYNLLVTIAPPAQSVINDLTWNGAPIGPDSGVTVYDETTSTYLVTTYGTFRFVVHDTDTLLESTGELTVRIDKDTPYYVSESHAPEEWTNGDVTVTLTADDALSPVTYSNGQSHLFTENGEFTFQFTDAAGNANSQTVTVGNIDKTTPVASISYSVGGQPYGGDYTNQDVTATISFENLAPVTVVNNGGSLSHTFTSNGQFTFYFTDAAGNSGSCLASVDKIDKIAPTAHVTYSQETWTNQDVIATLHVTDSFSGAGNDGATYTFAENGTHTFIARDRAGNQLTVPASTARIDKTPPTLSYTLTPAVQTPFSVFVTVSADESVTWLNNGGRTSLQFTSNGSFTFQAKDRAGNVAELPVTVTNISTEATPVVLTYSQTTPTNGNVYVTIAPKDPANDLIFVLNNNGAKTYTFTENGEFTFYYRNPAGKEGEAMASVLNIDKTPPTVQVTYSNTELTNGDVSAVIASDEAVVWPFGVKDGVYTFTQNGRLEIPVTDMVGNVTRVLLEVSCIDKTPPVISLLDDYQSVALGSQFDPMAGVSATDANGVPDGVVSSGDVDTGSVGDYTITYTATDAVGNVSTRTKHVTVYDPEQFNVIINGRMPVNSEVEVSGGAITLQTINQQGGLKLLLLPGKKSIGDFKRKGTAIGVEHTFTQSGYYTLYIRDDERNTKLVYLFVRQ